VDTYDSYFCSCNEGYTVLNAPYTCGAVTCDRNMADVVFILDSSTSVRASNPADGSYDNWQLLLEFVAQVVERLAVGIDSVRVGLVEYSDTATGVFNMNHYYDRTDLRTQILATPYLGGGRNTSGGIKVVHNAQYTYSCGDRDDVDNIAILITDGKSNVDVQNTIPEAISARADNIKLYTIGISNEIEVSELSEISSIPQRLNENYFLTHNYRTLSQLVNTIAQIPCTQTGPICTEGKADLVFIVDSSGSIRDTNPSDGGYDNWQLILKFMQNFVRNIPVASDQFRIGLIKYSDTAQNVFYLNRYNNRNDVINAIAALDYEGYNTNTADAISKMYNEQFTSTNGDRSDARNIAIVITDGESTINQGSTIPNAEEARRRGIQMFSVGITDQAKEQELRQISSQPQELNKNYYMSADFVSLNEILETIVGEACSSTGSSGNVFCKQTAEAGLVCFCREDTCTSRPINGTVCINQNECYSDNGGCQHVCQDLEGSYTCSCFNGYRLSADQRTCIDINECIELIPCRQGESCINTLGGYTCLSSMNAAAAVAAALEEEDLSGLAVGFAGMTVPGVIIGALLGVVATALLVIVVTLILRAVRGKQTNIDKTRRDSTDSTSTASSEQTSTQPTSKRERRDSLLDDGVENFGFDLGYKLGNV